MRVCETHGLPSWQLVVVQIWLIPPAKNEGNLVRISYRSGSYRGKLVLDKSPYHTIANQFNGKMERGCITLKSWI